MIPLVRVDNRLLHGQIMEAWVPFLRAQAIVVADDAVAGDPLAKAATLLPLSPDLPATIERVEDVDFARIAASDKRTLVLVRDISDLQRAVAAGLTPERGPRVNLGNIHYAPNRCQVTNSVFISESERGSLHALAQAGFLLEARGVPSDTPVGLAEIDRLCCGAR